MNRSTSPVGRILGIPIGLDYSWFLIFCCHLVAGHQLLSC
jgi:hypothetical protein